MVAISDDSRDATEVATELTGNPSKKRQRLVLVVTKGAVVVKARVTLEWSREF